MLRIIHEAATRHGADVLAIPDLLSVPQLADWQPLLTSAQLMPSRPVRHSPVAGARRWFAKNGLDHHPSQEGHMLMGMATAMHVERELLHAFFHTDRVVVEQEQTSGFAPSIGSQTPVKGSLTRETCYLQASHIPLQLGMKGNWKLATKALPAAQRASLNWATSAIGQATYSTSVLSC